MDFRKSTSKGRKKERKAGVCRKKAEKKKNGETEKGNKRRGKRRICNCMSHRTTKRD